MPVNILHLSDIHFGAEPHTKASATAIAKRDITLKALLNALDTIPTGWQPDIVAISGDIGWKGRDSDYAEASEWIQKLLDNLKLDTTRLITCPGNHDMDRSHTVGLAKHVDQNDADEILKAEHISDHFSTPFEGYSRFCDATGQPKFVVGGVEQSLFGVREILDTRFVVLNSAWFCRDNTDKSHLWLGLPQLQMMASNDQIIQPINYDTSAIQVALVHHPPDWFDQSELYSYADRPPGYEYLADRTHLILSGHVHAKVQRPTKFVSRAHVCVGGASYAGDQYRNNFSILQIDKADRELRRIHFEFQPSEGVWREIVDAEPYSLKVSLPSPQASKAITDTAEHHDTDYVELEAKAVSHAQSYIDQKAWAITRGGSLPSLINLTISAHDITERVLAKNQNLLLDADRDRGLFSDLVANERPTFLFGELGSGKSTVIGQHVLRLADIVRGVIPLIIPAKYFAGRDIRTLTSVAQSINEYVAGQIASNVPTFNILKALEQRYELTLVLDGFDELNRTEAQLLLKQAEALSRQWANLKVIATGRPIELSGLDYSYWQCLKILPLTSDQIWDLLYSEAIASNLSESDAVTDTSERFRILNDRSELLAIANTPLTVRLMRNELSESAESKSLGDLLYNILLERLGRWNISADQTEERNSFTEKYPDALSREDIVADVVDAMRTSGTSSLDYEQLYAAIEKSLNKGGTDALMTNDACRFMIRNVLHQDQDGVYVFPSQPLYQCAIGLSVYRSLIANQNQSFDVSESDLWREHSFAAMIARRKGKLQEILLPLKNYCARLIASEFAVSGVAMIVSESASADLAIDFLENIKSLGFRPFKYIYGLQEPSVRAFAHALNLAGHPGFQWFFENYLDPRYPSAHYEVDITADILRQLLLGRAFVLDSNEQNSLAKMIAPHTCSQSWASHSLLKIVAFAVPDKLSVNDLVNAYCESFIYKQMHKIAEARLRELFSLGHQELVLSGLERVCLRSDDRMAKASQLWMSLSGRKPNGLIVRSIVPACVRDKSDRLWNALLGQLGLESVESLLRLYVLMPDRVAAFSAILLHKLGNRDFGTLAPGLLQGLHDGGYVPEAEPILNGIIESTDINAISWLVSELNNDAYGSHSSYWRAILNWLSNSDSSYPEMLASCLPGLGEFILARYPEVRRMIRLLLVQKPEYREHLHRLLKSLNRKVRFGAAALLFISFPDSELESIETVALAAATRFELHEFIAFCLRIELGFEAKSKLHELSEKLVGRPRTFALAMLHHNDVPMTEAEFRGLVEGLLDSGSISENFGLSSARIPSALEDQRAFAYLILILSEKPELAKRAAGILLADHTDSLSDDQLVLCMTLSVTHLDLFSIKWADDVLNRSNDKHFLDKLSALCNPFLSNRTAEPILFTLAKSYRDQVECKHLLLKCLNELSNEFDQVCLWLVGKSKSHTAWSKLVGLAAHEILNESQSGQRPLPTSAKYGLALLANELGDADTTLIESLLTDSRADSLGKDILAALLSRLNGPPKGFICNNEQAYGVLDPAITEAANKLYSTEDIRYKFSERDRLPPHFVEIVEASLISNSLSEDDLATIASSRPFGSAFSLAIASCIGSRIQLDNLISCGAIRFPLNLDFSHRVLLQLIIREDGNALTERSQEYCELIEDTLSGRENESKAHAFTILLIHREYLKSNVWDFLLLELSEKPYHLDSQLADAMVRHILRITDSDAKQRLGDQIDSYISMLAVSQEKFLSLDHVRLNIVLSMISIYLAGEVHYEAGAMFAGALAAAILLRPTSSSGYWETNFQEPFLREAILSVSPLLGSIPGHLISDAVKIGLNSPDLEVAGISRILAAFSGGSK